MSDAKLPQRYDLVGEYDSYMSPVEEGDYVRVEDVQPLLAEIERLNARVAALEKHLGLMIANNLTGSFESEGMAIDRAVAVLPNWEEKATGYTRLQLDAAAQIVGLHDEEDKP